MSVTRDKLRELLQGPEQLSRQALEHVVSLLITEQEVQNKKLHELRSRLHEAEGNIAHLAKLLKAIVSTNSSKIQESGLVGMLPGD